MKKTKGFPVSDIHQLTSNDPDRSFFPKDFKIRIIHLPLLRIKKKRTYFSKAINVWRKETADPDNIKEANYVAFTVDLWASITQRRYTVSWTKTGWFTKRSHCSPLQNFLEYLLEKFLHMYCLIFNSYLKNPLKKILINAQYVKWNLQWVTPKWRSLQNYLQTSFEMEIEANKALQPESKKEEVKNLKQILNKWSTSWV